jgi:hypothetical protein
LFIRKSPKPKKSGKEPTRWDLGGGSKDVPNLERTVGKPEDENSPLPEHAYDTKVIECETESYIFLVLYFILILMPADM